MLMNRKLYSTTGLLAALALLVVINMLSGFLFKSMRLDLTQNRLYTLSDGTRNILADLDEPITLRFYFSEKVLVGIPNIMNYGRRVQELLEQYATLSHGKLKLIVYNPEPFSDYEDQAVQYGLQGVPVDTAGTLAYFGLVGTNSTDNQEVIPFFQPDKEDSLEYDISKLIYKLLNPKKRTVALMTTLPMFGDAQNPFARDDTTRQDWYIVEQLRQLFNVRKLETNAESIPDDIDVLMLVHPKNLSDETLFAIDQFVLKGGRAIVFVDPYAESDVPAVDPQNPMAAVNAPRNSSLGKLFDTWGVQLAPGMLAADRLSATQVSANMRGRTESMDYILWLTLGQDNFDKKDFVTSELKSITLATAGILSKKDDSGIEFTPLLETSKQSMEIPQSAVQFGPNPAALLSQFKSQDKSLVLAARISGNVKSAFPDGKPGSNSNGKGTPPDFVKESKKPINVIVVADTDMLQDKFWVNVQNFFGRRVAIPRTNNDVFVINAIDNLSGSNDLISLRSRGKSARPFDKVLELKREAGQRLQDKEKALQAKLDETERKLNELQQRKEGGNALILSPEQQAELGKFREQQVQTRKELRGVRHELGESIERLGAILKFINIGLIPLLIIISAGLLGVYAMRRKKKHAVSG